MNTNRTPNRKPTGAMQGLVKAEKLTQLAFALPVAAVVGWLLGALLDHVLHQHWIAIAGIVLGVIAGFVQVFRMIRSPGFMAASAPDLSAPRGPGFADRDADSNTTPGTGGDKR